MLIDIANKSIAELDNDAVILFLFEGEKDLSGPAGEADEAMSGAVKALFTEGDFKAGKKELAVIYPGASLEVKRIILAGLGKKDDFTLEELRCSSGIAAKRAHKQGADNVAVMLNLNPETSFSHETLAKTAIEGVLMALHQPRYHKTSTPERLPMTMGTLIFNSPAEEQEIQKGVDSGQIFADAACTAIDLVNKPGNFMTPSMLSDAARAIAMKESMECRILEKADLDKLGMGALLGVAKGSNENPKFIIMEYNASKENKGDNFPSVVLVGKGITFDSGGISLKASLHMEDMKSDMAGAAAVIGIMQGVARLKPSINVKALIPTCENLPSGDALKPGDVVNAMNGKSIEIISTDAEGRLILADALCYAQSFRPDMVIDIATLTGACVVALGENVAAGFFTTEDDFADKLIGAGDENGEKFWRLPLYKEYDEKIKSNVADVKNTGGRMGGVGASAIFLKAFVTFPWAHLDIASMALSKNSSSYKAKGGTGFSVRTLLSLLIQMAKDAT